MNTSKVDEEQKRRQSRLAERNVVGLCQERTLLLWKKVFAASADAAREFGLTYRGVEDMARVLMIWAGGFRRSFWKRCERRVIYGPSATGQMTWAFSCSMQAARNWRLMVLFWAEKEVFRAYP